MVNRINNINSLNIEESNVLKRINEHDEKSFSNIFVDAINNASKLEQEADDLTVKMAAGQVDNIHEVMVATQKAEISMRYLIEVRSKVLDAYNEIMRIQI